MRQFLEGALVVATAEFRRVRRQKLRWLLPLLALFGGVGLLWLFSGFRAQVMISATQVWSFCVITIWYGIAVLGANELVSSASVLVRDREDGVFPFLRLSGLSSGEIYAGKAVAVFTRGIKVFLVPMPIVATALYLSGRPLADLLPPLLVLLSATAAALCVSFLAFSLTRRTRYGQSISSLFLLMWLLVTGAVDGVLQMSGVSFRTGPIVALRDAAWQGRLSSAVSAALSSLVVCLVAALLTITMIERFSTEDRAPVAAAPAARARRMHSRRHPVVSLLLALLKSGQSRWRLLQRWLILAVLLVVMLPALLLPPLGIIFGVLIAMTTAGDIATQLLGLGRNQEIDDLVLVPMPPGTFEQILAKAMARWTWFVFPAFIVAEATGFRMLFVVLQNVDFLMNTDREFVSVLVIMPVVLPLALVRLWLCATYATAAALRLPPSLARIGAMMATVLVQTLIIVATFLAITRVSPVRDRATAYGILVIVGLVELFVYWFAGRLALAMASGRSAASLIQRDRASAPAS